MPSTGATRIVTDRGIAADMRLGAWDENVVYVKDGAVWRMRMGASGT